MNMAKDRKLLAKHFDVPAKEFEWKNADGCGFLWWYNPPAPYYSICIGTTEEGLHKDAKEVKTRLALQQIGIDFANGTYDSKKDYFPFLTAEERAEGERALQEMQAPRLPCTPETLTMLLEF